MRKTIISFSIFICGLPTIAQNYHPMLKPGRTWEFMTSNNQGGSNTFSTDNFKHSLGDTITINNTLYYTVIDETGNPFGIYVREDTLEQKVFTYYPSLNEEHLTFSFNHEIGDLLPPLAIHTNYEYLDTNNFSLLIDSNLYAEFIYELEIEDGTFRKYITSSNIQYMEGIGGDCGLLSGLDYDHETEIFLVSVMDGPIYIYGSLDINEIDTHLDIQYDHINKQLIIGYLEPYNYTIINSIGQIIKQGNVQGIIDVSELKSGIYIYNSYKAKQLKGQYKFIIP